MSGNVGNKLALVGDNSRQTVTSNWPLVPNGFKFDEELRMTLQQNGLHEGSRRPQQPRNWNFGWTLHHMIDWVNLRELWNGMVNSRLYAELQRYMEIIGFGDPALRERVVTAISQGTLHSLGPMHVDTLRESICWQAYNLFEGPSRPARRPHAADAHDMLEIPGATTFDFPVVAPPNGERAITLWRAFRIIENFGENAAHQPGELNQFFQLLDSVRHRGVIPCYDVNWFAVTKRRFWAMNQVEREEFFEACYRAGLMEADGNAVFEQLFPGR